MSPVIHRTDDGEGSTTLATVLIGIARKDLSPPQHDSVSETFDFLAITKEEVDALEPRHRDDTPTDPVAKGQCQRKVRKHCGYGISDRKAIDPPNLSPSSSGQRLPPFPHCGNFIRVDTSPPSHHNVTCPTSTTVLQLGARLSSGRIWTAFQATLASGPSSLESIELRWDPHYWRLPVNQQPPSRPSKPSASTVPGLLDGSPNASCDTSLDGPMPLVVRICFPEHHPVPDNTWDSSDPPESLERAIIHEATLYDSAAAKGLQGSVLPQWYGLFMSNPAANTSRIFVSVLEDVGPAAGSDGHTIPAILVGDVLRKFDALHEAGIAHGDLETRHVRLGNGYARHDEDHGWSRRKGDDLGLRIIDLDRAQVSPEAVANERLAVRKWLQVGGTGDWC